MSSGALKRLRKNVWAKNEQNIYEDEAFKVGLKSEKQFIYAQIQSKQDGNPCSKCFNFASTKDKQQVGF